MVTSIQGNVFEEMSLGKLELYEPEILRAGQGCLE